LEEAVEREKEIQEEDMKMRGRMAERHRQMKI
jgi:hypothetical protein